jgi:hypothetical protein
MNWAKKQGLRYFDMEGMDPDFARALVHQQALPKSIEQTHHWFKLAFGGEVVLLPDSHEIVLLPVLGWVHRNLWERVIRIRAVRAFVRKAFFKTLSGPHKFLLQ